MIVALWIVGIVVFLVGLAGYFFCCWFQPLYKAEVKMMEKDGKLDGEDEFMRTFRVGRAEVEMMANMRRIVWFRRVAFAGAIVIIALIIWGLVV